MIKEFCEKRYCELARKADFTSGNAFSIHYHISSLVFTSFLIIIKKV